MKRNIKKQFWLSREEAADLQKKAKKACLTEAALLRLLLKGYEPRAKPDDRFYEVIRELSSIGNNLNQLAAKAHSLNFIDAPKLEVEARRWGQFQLRVEQEFLQPEKKESKWR